MNFKFKNDSKQKRNSLFFAIHGYVHGWLKMIPICKFLRILVQKYWKNCSISSDDIFPVDKGRRLNVLCTLHLRPVSTGLTFFLVSKFSMEVFFPSLYDQFLKILTNFHGAPLPLFPRNFHPTCSFEMQNPCFTLRLSTGVTHKISGIT